MALGERRDLLLLRAPIPERGRYYHRLRAIVVRAGLLIVEERATLWHELVHAERGDEHCEGRDHLRQEARCHREAARRSIDLRDLADAMCWSDDEHEQADQLKTTVEYLRIRLDPRHLHPAERAYLRRQLEMKEQSA
ncbi:MAG: hypothetical protein JWM40_2939 [Frankiales bacterium]|nr:hypothetical protein [Frankiales bacterium]